MTGQLPQRKSPRLKDYDYSLNGAYFITICTQHRISYFGHIHEQVMHLNPVGEMVQEIWNRIGERFPAIECDLSVVMPNHIHGILVISQENKNNIIDAVQWFKSLTTNLYGKGVRENGWRVYKGKLWQRSFNDHIIRSEVALNELRKYVLYNPAMWERDDLFER